MEAVSEARCIDLVNNCQSLLVKNNNFCMYDTLKKNCQKSCDLCPVITDQLPTQPGVGTSRWDLNRIGKPILFIFLRVDRSNFFLSLPSWTNFFFKCADPWTQQQVTIEVAPSLPLDPILSSDTSLPLNPVLDYEQAPQPVIDRRSCHEKQEDQIKGKKFQSCQIYFYSPQ